LSGICQISLAVLAVPLAVLLKYLMFQTSDLRIISAYPVPTCIFIKAFWYDIGSFSSLKKEQMTIVPLQKGI
jgi:hypothetical protein